jgi:hypothetical protein
MKRLSLYIPLLLIAAVPGFGSSQARSVNSQNQIHFPANARKVSPASKLSDAHHRLNQRPELLPDPIAKQSPTHSAPQSKTQSRRALTPSNPPTGKPGFVSAAEIPLGGQPYGPVSAGDFNGDGKQDAVTLIQTFNSSNVMTPYISVVLSNGNGTFQVPVLTIVPGNDPCAAFVVGDVNGDGKDDVLIIHQSNCNSNTTSNFDVLIGNGDGTFTQGNNYVLSSNPLAGGTLQDVNGDGKLDAMVVDQPNGQNSNVVTLLGNGDGTFAAPSTIALSGEASQVDVADLNGDGILDVAATDYNTNELTVYLATSATTYASGVTYTTPDGYWDACSLTAGDLTGDGKPEIVNANCGDNNLTIFVNNGDGSFQTGVYNAAATGTSGGEKIDVNPAAVSIADVNGDGKADLISTNQSSADITVLLGNGDGTVQVPYVGYTVGGNYPRTQAIIADFNGDGLPDILIPDDAFSLAYLKGYGDGTFHAAVNYYIPTTDGGYTNGFGVASGDFNGDGYPDIVAGNDGDNTVGVVVFLSRPDGSLQPGVNYNSTSSNGNLLFVAVADFNQDGKLDIAAVDYVNGIVQIFNGNGDGTFTTGSTFATDVSNTEPYDLVAADFNGDGYPDLAVVNYYAGSSSDVGILINDGTGNFKPAVPYPISSYAWHGIAAGDLNGDGKIDLALPFYFGSSVAMLFGNGDGTFQTPETDVVLGASDPESVVIADLNGDNIMDMAVSLDNGSGEDVAVVLGTGNGNFGTPTLLASSLQNFNLFSPQPEFIKAADIDGDGNVDLVYANTGYGTVGILFGQGGGAFYDPVEYPTGGSPYGLIVADVNQDGSPDVITANQQGGGVTVALNASGSGTTGNYTITSSPANASVTAGSSATFTLTITPSNHYNGTLTFSCGNSLPSLATCAFNPPSVALAGDAPVTVQLTITTAAVSASLQVPHRNSSILLASLSSMGLLGMVLAGGLKRCNRWTGVVLGMLILIMMFSLVACGGSSSSTKSNPAIAKTATITTVSSSQSTVMVGTAVTFTGTVAATSGSATGTVTFLDGTKTLGTGTLSGTTATFQTGSLAAGVHNITASYGGDSNFNTSTSSALNQTVDNPGTPTGSYTVTVTATGTAGTNNGNTSAHPFNLTLTVQ